MSVNDMLDEALRRIRVLRIAVASALDTLDKKSLEHSTLLRALGDTGGNFDPISTEIDDTDEHLVCHVPGCRRVSKDGENTWMSFDLEGHDSTFTICPEHSQQALSVIRSVLKLPDTRSPL